MAEEIDLEKCNFLNIRSSVTLTFTLDRVEVTLVAYTVEVYPHIKLDRNRKKDFLWTDGRMYVRTGMTSNIDLLGHRVSMT